MNNLIREHFTILGTPKRGSSQQEAEEWAADHPGTNAYECTFCGKWHVGRKE